MTDNYKNGQSADPTPATTLALPVNAGDLTARVVIGAKPASWPAVPYRMTIYDAINGDETVRVSADAGWPDLTLSARGVEGADANHAAGCGVDPSVVTVGAVQDLAAAAAALSVPLTQKGAINGVATLDGGGLIPTSQLPALAIIDVHPVASQAAMLALTAQKGDIALRSDLNRSFVLSTNSPSTLADWLEILTPTDAVLSVAGRTGVVVLTSADVGLGNVTNDVQLKAADKDTDGTLAGNSDTKIPSQKAVKTYADAIAASRQPLNALLTDLAAETPSADDIQQYKAGHLVNRSLSQLAQDMKSLFAMYVRVATTAALAASTYSAGVITANANGALSIDGVSPAVGELVLVKNQATGANNGVYIVTNAGSGSTKWVLTRDVMFDTSAKAIPSGVIIVSEGTSNADTVWMLTTNKTITLGTTTLTFTQSGGTKTLFADRNPTVTSTFTLNAALIEKLALANTGTSAVASTDIIIMVNGGDTVTLPALASTSHGRRVKFVVPSASPASPATIRYTDDGSGDLPGGFDFTDGGAPPLYEWYLQTADGFIEFVADTSLGAGSRSWRVTNRAGARGEVRGQTTSNIDLPATSAPVTLDTIENVDLIAKDEWWLKIRGKFAANAHNKHFTFKVDGATKYDPGARTDSGKHWEIHVELAREDDTTALLGVTFMVDGVAPMTYHEIVTVDFATGVDVAVQHVSDNDNDTHLGFYSRGIRRFQA